MRFLYVAHFFCFVTYLYMAHAVLYRDRKTLLNWTCAILFVCFGIWSGGNALIHNPDASLVTLRWVFIAGALGGVPFPMAFLWFVLLLTDNTRILRNRWFVGGSIALVAGLVVAQWTGHIRVFSAHGLQPYGWSTELSFGPIGVAYILYYAAAWAWGVWLLFAASRRSGDAVRRKQARVIGIFGLVMFMVNYALAEVSQMSNGAIPNVGDIGYLGFAAGVLYAMTRYRLFALTPARAADMIIETMSDALILIDAEGIVRKANSAACTLFEGTQDGILGRSARTFMTESSFEALADSGLRTERASLSNFEGECVTLSGVRKPVLISYSVLRDGDGTRRGWVGVVRDMSEQRRLEREVLEAVGREQLRIAHDLHDGLGQQLIGIAFHSKALEQRLANGSGIAAGDLAGITEQLSHATDLVRELSAGLSPIPVPEEGLAAGLQELGQGAERMFGVTCTVNTDPRAVVADDLIAMHLYRIAQEAVTNAARHGRPKRIDLTFTRTAGSVVLRVSDDGSGIPEPQARGSGMGLRIMQYRARTIGAQLSVRRISGGGTIVQCALPIAEPGDSGSTV